ncbi:MAG: TetR/AcrR family transcriptional regulator [Myxococcota bacterium]
MPSYLDTDPRRDRILQAALVLCLERNPESVTIQQIRGLSGASTGSIYHHFRDKQGLFFELFLTATRNYHATVLEAVEFATGPRAFVRAVVRSHLDWMTEHTSLARFMQSARRSELVRGDEPDVKEQHRDFVDAVCQHLAPWVDAEQIRRLPCDMTMAVMLGPMEHYTAEWLMGRTLTEPSQAFGLLSEAAWEALRVVPSI